MIKNNQMKYKLILFVFLMCLINSQSNAQLGIGTNSPNASSMLDVTATNKGLLLPRMTNTQKNAISNPATGLIVFCTDCGSAGLMNIYNGTDWVRLDGNISNTPALTTTAVSAITATTASSGGNVISSSSTVTAKGICYSTSPNPTTANTIISGGTGTGSFTSSITGLTSTTTYYVRAYATNSSGTSYGDETSFTTSLGPGSVYGGGIIGYILVSGDAGYDANVIHGLILSDNYLGASTWGCNGNISVSNSFGTGAANTAAIIASNCATANTAAKLCNDYSVTVNGTTYSDWFLPSKDEALKLQSGYKTSSSISASMITYANFATSSQDITYPADVYYGISSGVNGGATNTYYKNVVNSVVGVRAVSSF